MLEVHLQRQSLITSGTCLAVELSCVTIPGLVSGLAIVYEPVGRCLFQVLHYRYVLFMVKEQVHRVWTSSTVQNEFVVYAKYQLSLVASSWS